MMTLLVFGIGGVSAFFVTWCFNDREESAARKFHEAHHGDAIDWRALRGHSGVFVATVVRLECIRLDTEERIAKAKLVHSYHPMTPAHYFCGESSGTGTMEKPTCPDCLFWYVSPAERLRFRA